MCVVLCTFIEVELKENNDVSDKESSEREPSCVVELKAWMGLDWALVSELSNQNLEFAFLVFGDEMKWTNLKENSSPNV